MSKKNMGLLMAVLVLLALHFAYFLESRKDVLEGAYFTSGSTLLSNGESYTVRVRIQAHDGRVHDFEQIKCDSQKFSFTMVNSLFGSAVFLTNPVSAGQLLKNIALSDRDIAFNYAYYSSLASRMTLYQLNAGPGTPCFYIRELERVLCFGEDRSRVELPL